MDFLLEKVKDNLYVVAIWDAEWNTYNNCYLFLEKDEVTVIDSCKEEHSKHLLQALHKLGKTADDVKLLLATHAHEDHVEGAALFEKAKKFIHPKEKGEGLKGFDADLADQGSIQDFEYCLVGYHSPGSVIYYHHPTNVLFTGDVLCFFGDPLSKEGLVSKGEELRQAWIDYLKGGGVNASDLPDFLDGLRAILSFDSDVLCSGHGGVLTRGVNDFLEELLNEVVKQLTTEAD
jgi:glyoxylase-like metal-dependent hydrolase (beta-lactamase superfamily II)